MKLSFLFFKKLYANRTIITVINPATAYTTIKYNMTVTKFKYHGYLSYYHNIFIPKRYIPLFFLSDKLL